MKQTALAGMAGTVLAYGAQDRSASGSAPARAEAPDEPRDPDGGVPVRWLEGKAPVFLEGTTWGGPWPRGEQQPEQSFGLSARDGRELPVQAWPLAYWPDGSLKWTAHAVGPEAGGIDRLLLKPGQQSAASGAGVSVKVNEQGDAIEVDTGPVRWRLGKSGTDLIQAVERDGRTVLEGGRLVGLRQEGPDEGGAATPDREDFASRIESAVVEQDGPVRAVVRLEGKHETESGKAWLPFVVRLYFYGGSDNVRLMHTFIYDGDAERDFIKALGVRFAVPMSDEPHDRHVRFGGEGRGIWGEAVRGISGLRRDPGEEDRREREEALGFDLRSGNLQSAHSRLAGYAAHALQNPEVAEQAWKVFYADDARWAPWRYKHESRQIEGPDVLRPIEERDWGSTNDSLQWGLAAIQNLALIGDHLPSNDPRTKG